jgi:transmembrane sensor
LGDLRQAAAWFVRRRRVNQSIDERLRFLEWRQADTGREQAYAEIEATWDVLGALADDEAVRDFLAEPAASALTGRQGVRARRAWWSGGVATAAAAVAAILVMAPGDKVYATGVGEQRTLTLPDGAIVTLDTDSRVRIRDTRRGRVVRLERGEAYFDLSRRNPRSPLRVSVRRVDIGGDMAAFDVRDIAGVATLEVLEGSVKAGPGGADAPQPTTFQAGERAQVQADGDLARDGAAQVRRVIEWRAGRVYFDDTPLGAATAEMNRYSHTKLALAPGLGDIRISGLFRMDGARDFALALKVNNGVRIDDRGDRIRIGGAGS